ncbi:BgtTE-56089 [Blumeria graminis f. sp. tritici]|uniref:BgtTE-56089 n=1 Tax=Blumeria graminis f. sp. tritici TaxID=62690 RepID=A0A9X9QEY8_BLUGR|nr:BgtTE-56089 [Blumeria graminis f. sp. tritici]
MLSWWLLAQFPRWEAFIGRIWPLRLLPHFHVVPSGLVPTLFLPELAQIIRETFVLPRGWSRTCPCSVHLSHVDYPSTH